MTLPYSYTLLPPHESTIFLGVLRHSAFGVRQGHDLLAPLNKKNTSIILIKYLGPRVAFGAYSCRSRCSIYEVGTAHSKVNMFAIDSETKCYLFITPRSCILQVAYLRALPRKRLRQCSQRNVQEVIRRSDSILAHLRNDFRRIGHSKANLVASL